MKCLNTKGCYSKETRNGSNFCSDDCRLIYENRKKPPKRTRQIYDDPERQLIHDIYIKYYGKQETPTNNRGVKKGTKRGSYVKKHTKKRTFICKGCGRTFTLKSKRKKQFHSETCRRGYWRRMKRQKDVEEKMNRKY